MRSPTSDRGLARTGAVLLAAAPAAWALALLYPALSLPLIGDDYHW